MILQALYQLAQREDLVSDPDFEPRQIAWLVRISSDGKLIGIEGTHYIPPKEAEKKKPRSVAKTYIVPRQPQRSGTKAKPGRLVDNALYVFGIDLKDGLEKEQVRERAKWFREEVEAWANGSDDEAVKSVLKFLSDLSIGAQNVKLPEDCKSNDLFAFVYAPDVDQLVTDREAVKSYWRSMRTEGSQEEGEFFCLVSGGKCHPDLFPKVKMPGGNPSGVGIVAYNAAAFESYGWSRNQNGPISRHASEACSTSFDRLLSPAYPDPHLPGQTLPRRNLRLSSDTAVLFWAADNRGDEFCSIFSGLLEGNPEQVKELYQSIWKGKSPDLEDPTAFYALTITGTQGRAILRDWLESTVGRTVKNLALHFADLDIVRNTPKPRKNDLPHQIPVTLLLESFAPRGDRDQVPSLLTSSLVKAALLGSPYPLSVLERALERTRAEIGRSDWPDQNRRDARSALIKAVLNRRRRLGLTTATYKEVKRDMDPRNDNQGYSLGLLMAVLERLQQTAQGDVNATVVDRYFSSASATPKIAFVRLMKNARHHVRKVKDDPEKRGMVYRIEKLMDELASRFDPRANGFPTYLNLEQQGLFILGYHQMRHWLWMKKEDRLQWERDNLDAPQAFLWSKEHPLEINS